MQPRITNDRGDAVPDAVWDASGSRRRLEALRPPGPAVVSE